MGSGATNRREWLVFISIFNSIFSIANNINNNNKIMTYSIEYQIRELLMLSKIIKSNYVPICGSLYK